MYHKEKCYEENNEISTKKALCKKFNLSTKKYVCLQPTIVVYVHCICHIKHTCKF